ncbi:MAG: hypothetical protein ACR2KB_12565 [Chitinophagaceae bacterium]
MKKLIGPFILIFIGCNHIAKHNEGKIDVDILDTLYGKGISNRNDSTCSILLVGYYKRFGIYISKYYLVEDSLSIDLNGDKNIDTLVVLSPISLELVESASCVLDTSPKRLLVEIINNNGKSSIRNVYTNLISDVGGALSPYNGMTRTENGFNIKHHAGAKYSWGYTMEFVPNENMILTLKKISKICSYDGQDKKFEYLYNDFDLQTMSIQDTLDINCGCDKAWLELEK